MNRNEWSDIARCVGIKRSPAKYKAIANMWDLLQALYCTYHGPSPLNCAAVAKAFHRHCTVGRASWYLVSLVHDVDGMLQNIWPFGLAMYFGDLSQSINHFLKHGRQVEREDEVPRLGLGLANQVGRQLGGLVLLNQKAQHRSSDVLPTF